MPLNSRGRPKKGRDGQRCPFLFREAHARAHARAHAPASAPAPAHTHAHAHARTHAQTHAHTHMCGLCGASATCATCATCAISTCATCATCCCCATCATCCATYAQGSICGQDETQGGCRRVRWQSRLRGRLLRCRSRLRGGGDRGWRDGDARLGREPDHGHGGPIQKQGTIQRGHFQVEHGQSDQHGRHVRVCGEVRPGYRHQWRQVEHGRRDENGLHVQRSR